MPGAVTIATNMAGRGTDIQLGGNLEMRIQQEIRSEISDEAVRARKIEKIEGEIAEAKKIALDAGGLYVIGTERHESRRIDNQLRGRSGRQGDPGDSKFFLSLEDDLMRIFGSDRMDGMLQRLGLEEGEAIIHPWVNKALEKAQQKVEARNFEIRKNLLKYDDVMNDQRKEIYEPAQGAHARRRCARYRSPKCATRPSTTLVERCHTAEKPTPSNGRSSTLHEECLRLFGLNLPVEDWAKEEGIADQEIRQRITDEINRKMAAKTANYGAEIMRSLEKQILLMVVDKQWKDHLLSLDHLRHGIVLRAYGQRDPLNEYKREAFELFETMLAEVRDEVTALLARFELRAAEPEAAVIPREQQAMTETRRDPALAGAEPAMATAGGAEPAEQAARPAPKRSSEAQPFNPNDPSTWGKVPRNALCPCGSGKKYKHCHGKLS